MKPRCGNRAVLAALPLPIRYLIALLAWAGLVLFDLWLRLWFIAFLPILWLRSWQSQPNTQLMVNAADFIYRPLRPFPLLLGNRRSRSASRRTKSLQ